MKIHETLISLLIFVILSVANAEPQIPAIDKIGVSRNWLLDKCIKNGEPGAYESAMNSVDDLSNCLKSVVNVREIQLKMMFARSDKLDGVFEETCSRRPILERCLKRVSDAIVPCLDSKEKEDIKINDKMTSSILEFICQNGGDRIAMFIAGGGPECVIDKQSELEACAAPSLESFRASLETGIPDLSRHPLMNLNPEKCLKLEKTTNCGLAVLETCPDPKIADLMDALYKVVRKETPCDELTHSTPTVTDVSEGVGQDRETVKSEVTVEELQKKTFVKQIEAAEAQIRAANAQERAAVAQEQAATVAKQVVKAFLDKKPIQPISSPFSEK